jgi:branched-chain amino acid aminotransferase
VSEFPYWVNGNFVPASQAAIPLDHRGFRSGDAVFDTERTFNGKIFRLREHLERMERSLRYTRIDPGIGMEELAQASEQTVERNRHLLPEYGDFWVTQLIARGNGANPVKPGPAFVAVVLRQLAYAKMAPLYEKGAPLIIPTVRSATVGGVDPKVKSVSRLHFALGDLEAKERDPDGVALMVDDRGNLAEVVSGNLFVVTHGVVRTPGSQSILEGVSRATTIELCRRDGLPVQAGDLQPYDLYTADEAFFTTTSICIMPVRSLNGAPVGKAVPGAITRKLTDSWNRLVGLDIPGQFRSQAAKLAAKAAQPPPAAR